MEEKLFLRPIVLLLHFSLLSGVRSAATFTFVNRCGFTVWPGVLSNAGVAALSTTGFALHGGETETIDAPTGWGGRFWGRTYCGRQGTNGQFLCATGDCRSGRLACDGAGAEPPVTLAEFTLDGADGKDFYDISLVDGFNLPMLVVPQGGSGVNCTSAGCLEDLNIGCPTQLRVTADDNGGGAVACKSACDAFGSDQHCCSGAYATPASCKPSQFSQTFKRACPQAYSYAYDDETSTFTCTGGDYTIIFCPSPNTSLKSSSGGQTGVTAEDSHMIYEGASEMSAASDTRCWHALRAAGAVWWLLSLL